MGRLLLRTGIWYRDWIPVRQVRTTYCHPCCGDLINAGMILKNEQKFFSDRRYKEAKVTETREECRRDHVSLSTHRLSDFRQVMGSPYASIFPQRNGD